MSIAIILQARLGSARVPGQVLNKLAGRTLLEHCVARLQTSGLPIVVATTTDAQDDAVQSAAEALGVSVYGLGDGPGAGGLGSAGTARCGLAVVRNVARRPAQRRAAQRHRSITSAGGP